MEDKGTRHGKAICFALDSCNGRLYHFMYMIPCKRNDPEFFLRRIPLSTRLCHTRVSPLLIILSSSMPCLLMGDSPFFLKLHPFPGSIKQASHPSRTVVSLCFACMINVSIFAKWDMGQWSWNVAKPVKRSWHRNQMHSSFFNVCNLFCMVF